MFDKEKELLVDFLLIGREAMNYAGINDANCDLMPTETKYQDIILDFEINMTCLEKLHIGY